MTLLYRRTDGHTPIPWEPEHINHGKQAVESVVDTPDSYPVDVDSQTAAQIREEYRKLVEQQTDGGTA